MSDTVEIELDGRLLRVPSDGSLAAALMNAGVTGFRTSMSGAPRGPLCGMGVCYECRVSVDGAAHRRACLEPVRAGMRVVTGG
ncbi:MAG TPA: (2Fe-2S)-binding protein [Longimicrobiaceae bacterium]|nr:(2Fe-2S)-binding protein [Longimicrobiaceae bacterium]